MVSFEGDSANPRAGLEVMVWRKTTVAVGKGEQVLLYEGWNFNSGNYLFTTGTK